MRPWSLYHARMLPWNDWYHVNGNTYGTWLRGDARGFRARHHREHVEGDYRNPPAPGAHSGIFDRSRRLMTREPVHLSQAARELACVSMAKSLLRHSIQVLAVAVDDHHFHALARFPDRNPRKWIGIAKKDSARALSGAGMSSKGGVWAVRCRCLPVRDRGHQVNVLRYILKHARRGASVWTWREQKDA